MWIVDTCIVLDVFENDPKFGAPSAKLLQKLLPDGLAVSPVMVVELAAAFVGDLEEEKRFLDPPASRILKRGVLLIQKLHTWPGMLM